MINFNINNPSGRDVLLTEKVYDNQFFHNGKVLKRGSIVLALDGIDSNSNPNVMTRVKVVSENNEHLNSIISKSRDELLLGKGDEGYLPIDSIKPIKSNDSVLFLKKDTRLLSIDGSLAKVDGGIGLRPIESGGMYKINQCRVNGEVKYFYLFQKINSSENETYQIHESHYMCLPLDFMSKKSFENVNRFLKSMEGFYGNNFKTDSLEYNEWGMVNLPSIIVNPNTREIVSHSIDLSYVHYKGGDPLHSDSWGHPDTICELISIAREWHQFCQNKLGKSKKQCTMQIGDISFITPGKMQSGKDPLYHKHHNDGTCVDMRPLRVDDAWIGTTINYDTLGHDSNLNKAFIDFVSERNASPIYYGDQKILSRNSKATRDCDMTNPNNDLDKGVLGCPGHMNHIHFCLKPNRVRGCKK